MRTYPLIVFVAIFLAGVSSAVPARADGPSMQETEQYIYNSIINNFDTDDADAQGTIDQLSVTNCMLSLDASEKYWNGFGQKSSTQITVPMKKVSNAFVDDRNGLHIEIDSWFHAQTLSQISVVQNSDGSANDDVTDTEQVYIYLRDETLAARLARAIVHWSQLCGSTAPTDPFSN